MFPDFVRLFFQWWVDRPIFMPVCPCDNRSDVDPYNGGGCRVCHVVLATYASSVSFGHPEHFFSTVWTAKSLGQDLLMMTILEDSACSVTPTIQIKQLLA